MRLNTDPDDPPRLPCLRDYAELVNQHLPPDAVIKLVPMKELRRRGEEIIAEHPHLREEVPVRLEIEEKRRSRHQLGLHLTTDHPPLQQRHA